MSKYHIRANPIQFIVQITLSLKVNSEAILKESEEPFTTYVKQ